MNLELDRDAPEQWPRAWSPDMFIPMCTEAGYRGPTELANQAYVELYEILQIQDGGAVNLDVAQRIAPLLMDMDPQLFFVMVNARHTADALVTGRISLKLATKERDRLVIQTTEIEGDVGEVFYDTVSYLEDAIERHKSFLLMNKDRYPVIKGSWLTPSPAPLDPITASTISG